MKEQLWFEKYRPIRMLATGEKTEVVLAEHVTLNDMRVIKRIRKVDGREQLMAEAEVLKQLQHPCIPRILDFNEDEEYCCIIEEYVAGETLREYVEHQGTLSFAETVEYTQQLCNLVAYLHHSTGKLIHCDLHPDNLMISQGRVKLVDFGCAHYLYRTNRFAEQFGNEAFAAPEQKTGSRRDERTDLYAVGRIIQYMLQHTEENLVYDGRRKRQPFFIRRKEDTLQEKLKQIVIRCTEKLPEKRYRYVEELGRELNVLCENKAYKKNTDDSDRRIGAKAGRGVIAIGVIGTHRAVGVTHTTLMLAHYLHRFCYPRIAVIELSGNSDLRCFSTGSRTDEMSPCRRCGIDLFPDAGSLLAGTLRNGDYDCCIYDLGSRYDSREEELLRCDCKLVLTDSAEWHRDAFQQFMQQQTGIQCWESWWLLINFAAKKIHPLTGNVPMRAECIGLSPDPFQITEQNKELFRKITATF